MRFDCTFWIAALTAAMIAAELVLFVMEPSKNGWIVTARVGATRPRNRATPRVWPSSNVDSR